MLLFLRLTASALHLATSHRCKKSKLCSVLTYRRWLATPAVFTHLPIALPWCSYIAGTNQIRMRLCTVYTPQPRSTPQLTCRWRQAICSRGGPRSATLLHGIPARMQGWCWGTYGRYHTVHTVHTHVLEDSGICIKVRHTTTALSRYVGASSHLDHVL